MYLIDSSLWIEFLRPRGSAIAKKRIREALQREEAFSCGIIRVEVLRGARNDADFEVLQQSLSALPQIPIDEEVIERAARWGHKMDRKGKIVSTTDLLIASCSFGRATLLHADSDFELVASEFSLHQEHVS